MNKKYIGLGLGLLLFSQMMTIPVAKANHLGIEGEASLQTDSDTSRNHIFETKNVNVNKTENNHSSESDPLSNQWQEIAFGQSTSLMKNTISTLPNGNIKIIADEGGKITKGHDGITYYYIEIDAAKENFTLSATFQVHSYGKKPYHDAQESFGIMARDAIGINGDSSVFSANMVALGGFANNASSPQEIQLVMRKGVTTPTGETGEGLTRKTVEPDIPSSTFTLTLKKDNSGFTGQVNDGESEFLFAPEHLLNTQNGKLYLGFYAARMADIEISNIQLDTRLQSEDPEREEAPEEKIEPSFKLTALRKTGTQFYEMIGESNVSGKLDVLQNGQPIVHDLIVTAGKKAYVSTELTASSTPFEVCFYPENSESVTSNEPIIQKFDVEYRTFTGDIYAASDGKAAASGDRAHPVDVDTAIAFVQSGQKVILKNGTYKRTTKLEFPKLSNGSEQAKKSFEAETPGKVTFDFGTTSEGVVLSGDWWHIKGINVTQTKPNVKGFVVGGNYNIVEQVQTYRNGDTGLQISRTDESPYREDWPKNNLILNCDSYENDDPAHNNADGFAAKLTIGAGNKFYGCISHHNADDGFDLYNKVETGASQPVTIEKCIAYENGYAANGEKLNDGSGFKMGGEGLKVKHLLKDSLTFNNAHFGVSSNSNPQLMVQNVVSYNNKTRNFNLATYNNVTGEFVVDSAFSLQKDHTGKDEYPESLFSKTTFFFNGKESQNAENKKLTAGDFESTTPVLPYQRNTDGSIQFGQFLKFKKTTTTPPVSQAIPIYRAYNPNDGDHLYTMDFDEFCKITAGGWQDEGIAFYGAPSGIKIYRLYNPNSGEHFYTKDLDEYEYVEKCGWRGEGLAFYSVSKEKGVAIYRSFNPNATGPGSHLFTISKKEINDIVSKGWKDEGTAFYTLNN